MGLPRLSSAVVSGLVLVVLIGGLVFLFQNHFTTRPPVAAEPFVPVRPATLSERLPVHYSRNPFVRLTEEFRDHLDIVSAYREQSDTLTRTEYFRINGLQDPARALNDWPAEWKSLPARAHLDALLTEANAIQTQTGFDFKMHKEVPVASAQAGQTLLVLSLREPKIHFTANDLATCEDMASGNYLVGAARLRAFDNTGKVLDTYALVNYWHERGKILDFQRIPFSTRTPNGQLPGKSFRYPVAPDGRVNVLQLRDLTGDGKAAEFTLAHAVGCHATFTRCIGWDENRQRIVPIKAYFHDHRPSARVESWHARTWVDRFFIRPQAKPGVYDVGFTVDAEKGVRIKYKARYKASVGGFVGHRYYEKIPGFAAQPKIAPAKPPKASENRVNSPNTPAVKTPKTPGKRPTDAPEIRPQTPEPDEVFVEEDVEVFAGEDLAPELDDEPALDLDEADSDLDNALMDEDFGLEEDFEFEVEEDFEDDFDDLDDL